MIVTKQECRRCNGTGWIGPIGPCSDGSYITTRPCPRCRGEGFEYTRTDEKGVDQS